MKEEEIRLRIDGKLLGGSTKSEVLMMQHTADAGRKELPDARNEHSVVTHTSWKAAEVCQVADLQSLLRVLRMMRERKKVSLAAVYPDNTVVVSGRAVVTGVRIECGTSGAATMTVNLDGSGELERGPQYAPEANAYGLELDFPFMLGGGLREFND